jgi:nitrite reductase (NADH) small subunit
MNREREARLALADAPVEGSVRLLDLGGHPVGVYRVGDDFYALASRCPHRGAPLCAGMVTRSGDVVRCPWHKWEFEIATGRSLVDPRLRVRRYGVRVDGDQLVVSLD